MTERAMRALVLETDLPDLVSEIKTELEHEKMLVTEEQTEGFPNLVKLYVDLADEHRAFDIIDKLLTEQPS